MSEDPKTRFTARVADYVAGRPTYPLDVLAWLGRTIGFDADWQVADVGAGTGLSTALFLGNGNAVTAVEPNDAMRAAADALFAEDADYDSLAGSADATGLAGGSVDLVVAAQAFHWFDPGAFARECQRLLSPRGRVLLMWNTFDAQATPAAAAYDAVVRRHALELDRVQNKWRDSEAVARQWFTPETFHEGVLANAQSCDAERLLTRLASSSYMPRRQDAGFAAMRDDLNAAFAAHASDGRFTLPYACKLFAGVPRA
jgi:SAM-dependent methyltransferase